MTAGEFAASFDDVRAAAGRLRGIAHRTPVITSRSLDERAGASAFLKAENLQRMGAFKFRGAYNRIVRLDAAARERGVVAYSSGNHAQGVALAGKLTGTPATIVMPEDAPASKLDATREYGAEVITYVRSEDDRAAIARGICEARGATLLPPYDDPDVIAGQGTVALELLEDVESLDILLVCVGGGGLLAGCCLAAQRLNPALAIYGVEPEAGNDFQRSLEAGERITIGVPDTIADGMQTLSPGELTFPIVRRYARGIVTVTDEEIRSAMRFAFERLKMVLEPSGAAALAALLFAKVDAKGKRVGVTISGGNVDAATFGRLVAL